MSTMIKYLVVLAWLCFSPKVFSAQQEAIDWQNKELIIKGDYLHAILIAEKDFSARIANRASNPERQKTKADHKLAEYLSKIDNYNIEIGMGNNRYLVWITPRLTKEFPVIFGGDALYIIDADTFQLIEKQLGK